MGGNQLRPFAYAHSPAIMKALIAEAKIGALLSPAAMTSLKSPSKIRLLTK